MTQKPPRGANPEGPLDEAPHVRHIPIRPVLRDALPRIIILDARHGRPDGRLKGPEEKPDGARPVPVFLREPLEVGVL